MSEANAEPVKCAVCGQSCEGKPHAKDTKGRIICRPCIDKKTAVRAATDAGGKDVMAGLLAKSKMANATPCPSCKSYMPEGTIICTHCGYNTQTGKAASTRVFAAPKEKAAKSGGGGMSLSFDPTMGVWVMVVIYAALAVGCFAMPPLLLLMWVVLALHGTVVWVWYIIVAFMDGDALWGIIMLIPLVNILGLYYILVKSERFILKRHFLVNFGFGVLMGLLATSVLPTEAEMNAAAGSRVAAPAQLG